MITVEFIYAAAQGWIGAEKRLLGARALVDAATKAVWTARGFAYVAAGTFTRQLSSVLTRWKESSGHVVLLLDEVHVADRHDDATMSATIQQVLEATRKWSSDSGTVVVGLISATPYQAWCRRLGAGPFITTMDRSRFGVDEEDVQDPHRSICPRGGGPDGHNSTRVLLDGIFASSRWWSRLLPVPSLVVVWDFWTINSSKQIWFEIHQ